MSDPRRSSGPLGPKRTSLKRSSSLSGLRKLGSHSVEKAPEGSHTESHSDIDPTVETPLFEHEASQMDSIEENAQRLKDLAFSLAPKISQLDPDNLLLSTEFGQKLEKAADNIIKIKEAVNDDEKLTSKDKKSLLGKLENSLTKTTELYHAFHIGIMGARSGASEMGAILANQKSKFDPGSREYEVLNNIHGLLSKFQMETVSVTTALFNPSHPNAGEDAYENLSALSQKIKGLAQEISQQRLLKGDDLERFNSAMTSFQSLVSAQNILFDLKDDVLADLSPKERKDLEKALTRIGEAEQNDMLVAIKVLAAIAIIALLVVAILTGVIVFTPAMIGSWVVGLIVLNELFPDEIEGSLPSKTLKSLDDYMATIDQLSLDN